MATTEGVDTLIRATEAAIRQNWYGPQPCKPAQLVITHCDGVTEHGFSAYDSKNDVIYIDVPPGNLSDSNVLTPEDWPIWKLDLVEEMLHEFQYKRVQSARLDGKALCKAWGQKFSGRGHDDAFFTAIAIHAEYFDMTPEKLIATLCGKPVVPPHAIPVLPE